MADIIKTRAELEALLADNTLGNISAQDLRDLLKSTHLMSDLDQVVTVAKAGGQYTSIQSAINSISDATSAKIYTVLVYPGEYDEAITLGNYIDIVAINPENTKILKQVGDNSVECHCYLRITIESNDGYGFYQQSVGSDILIDGNVGSSAKSGILVEGGSLTIKNGTIKTTRDDEWGHGIEILVDTVILQNCKILCTHTGANSIYAAVAQNVRCMNVWANRDDDVNVTQLIVGGFNFDANVQ